MESAARWAKGMVQVKEQATALAKGVAKGCTKEPTDRRRVQMRSKSRNHHQWENSDKRLDGLP